MIKLELNGSWEMRSVEEACFQAAKVPGTVYTDLLRNGNMEDPFFRDNEDAVCARMNEDYEYRRTFQADQELLSCKKVLLSFEGLDTIADIYVNGCLAGKAFNMHRLWEFDIKEWLSCGENELRIVFSSPLRFIAEAYKKYGNIGNEDTYEGFMHLRKAHYMFGWDWGAHLPDAGIFRPVSILGIQEGRIGTVHIRQENGDRQVRLKIQAETEFLEEETVCLKARILPPEGDAFEVLLDQEGYGEVLVENPQLWWPNGLGGQPLYQVCVTMEGKEGLQDVWERKIGLRTLTMHREKDAWGECFACRVNGKDVFAMGADYIPEDHLLGRRSREKTQRLLEDCRLANYNSIRVWGGGFYPDDWFYDLCDEYGLIVWQDFMFACSVYELTEEFEANIRQEFVDNIRRIRHHASLGLWCGNNEMEMFVDERCWVTKPTEVRDYLLMYERIIPEVLKKEDPDTFYWPASPSSGGSFDDPNSPDRGDVHYWKVWHGGRPFSEYRKFFFRYASEFGFQAFPALSTLKEITDKEEDLNPFSYIIEKHQRNYGANGKIMNYMQQMYRYPNSFALFIYASQLLQADAIRYGVEHFRRNRNENRCMGAVYWQLNDCWPVISWSSIDYCGRWKALHYYAKRFFAPLLLSVEEEGWMTKEANMNRQHFEFEKSIRLNVANETLKERTITVRWAVYGAEGTVHGKVHEYQVKVLPLSTVWMDKVMLPDIDVFSEYVGYEAEESGTVISSGTVIFSYPKYFRYQDPKLTVSAEGDTLVVRSEAYAKSVEIQNQEENLLLEDNYFDMNRGERRIKVLRGNTEGLQVRSVYDIK